MRKTPHILGLLTVLGLVVVVSAWLHDGVAATDRDTSDCASVQRRGGTRTSGAGALMVGADVGDLAGEADLVVSGTVEKFQTCRVDGPVTIVTRVTIAPDAVWKIDAAPGGPLTIEVPGGYIDGHHLAAGISPEFTVGERAVVFLAVGDDGVVWPSAGFQGKFTVSPDGTLDRAGLTLDRLRAAVARATTGDLPDADDPLTGGPEIIESAFVGIGTKFADSAIPVPIHINPNNNRPPQLTAQQARLAAIQAFHTWQNLPNSYIAFGPVKDTTRTSAQGDCNGTFDTTFGIAGSHSANTLAVTWTCYNASGIVDADVEIDTDHFGAAWAVDGSGACSSGKYDLQTVLLHENGHFLGLGHPTNQACGIICPIMDASYGGVQHNACADDEAGANSLYPLAGGSVPAAPALLTALGTSSITLNWTDVSGEWGYEIWRAEGLCLLVTSGDFKLLDTVPDGTLTYDDTDYNNGLPVGQPFCYKVRAFNKNGNSGFSLTADGIVGGGGTPTPSPTPPATPSPSPSPAPTQTPSPTATPSPSPTPQPTASPVPATSQPVPTATSAPQPSQTATPTPGASPPAAPTLTPSPTPGTPGDVDCDGEWTTADSLDILRIAGDLEPHGDCPQNADYDGNGQVKAADAIAVLSNVAVSRAPFG